MVAERPRAIRDGRIQMSATDDQDREVMVSIYYDATWQGDIDAAPLVNGPRGWCLDVTNVSGRRVTITVSSVFGDLDVLVGKGDPVTSGAGRSRTAAEMQLQGYSTRGSLGQLSIS